MIEQNKIKEAGISFNQKAINHHIEKVNIKRVLDIAISFVSIILLSPFLLIISVLIFIFDGRPILFKQIRSGVHYTPFTIYKFRTMRESKEVMYHWQDKVPDDFVFKGESNPSITPLGKILRKTSLDELPQLFNVLKGEMSIVGPRPEVPRITRFYDSHQAQRLVVKPGMTGFAQINGRSDITHGQKINFDLYYVYNQSIGLDFKILLKTFKIVLRRKGSY